MNTVVRAHTLIPAKKAYYCLQFYSRSTPVCKHFCDLLNVKKYTHLFSNSGVQQGLNPNVKRKKS